MSSPAGRQFVIALTAGAALAAVLSYPTIARPGSVARVDTDDGKFSVWNVAWVAHALVDDPRNVFNANIFYPRTGTLAYSEANLVAGALAAPVYAVTRNPLAAHNVAVFLILILAFVSMWALVRRLTGSWIGAIVAATGFAFAPYVAAKTAHVQLLMVWVFPLVFLAFHRLVEAPGLWRGMGLGLSLALAALSCGYYGIFAGLAIGFAALWFAFGHPHQRRYWTGLALAVVVSGALVAPVLRPYLELRSRRAPAGPSISTKHATTRRICARISRRRRACTNGWAIDVLTGLGSRERGTVSGRSHHGFRRLRRLGGHARLARAAPGSIRQARVESSRSTWRWRCCRCGRRSGPQRAFTACSLTRRRSCRSCARPARFGALVVFCARRSRRFRTRAAADRPAPVARGCADGGCRDRSGRGAVGSPRARSAARGRTVVSRIFRAAVSSSSTSRIDRPSSSGTRATCSTRSGTGSR